MTLACCFANLLCMGAVSRFEGQVAVFNHKNENMGMLLLIIATCFLNHHWKTEVLNCAEAGVLGVLPGIIGTMQANETIKLITGIGKPLINTVAYL